MGTGNKQWNKQGIRIPFLILNINVLAIRPSFSQWRQYFFPRLLHDTFGGEFIKRRSLYKMKLFRAHVLGVTMGPSPSSFLRSCEHKRQIQIEPGIRGRSFPHPLLEPFHDLVIRRHFSSIGPRMFLRFWLGGKTLSLQLGKPKSLSIRL
jgi:hypothetical protein